MKKHNKKGAKNTSSDTPSRSHKCRHCDKSFLHKIGLKEHERIHLEKIKCPLCDKSYVSYYLEKHLRTHSGDHPYTCSLCPNRHYTTPNALRTHMRRRHPVQKIEIKHKKGTKKAMIQVSDKPLNPATLMVSNTVDVVEEDASANEEGGDESLPNMEPMPSQSEVEASSSVHMEVTPIDESVTPAQIEDAPPTVRVDESETSKILVPISIAGVIQQAAAANNIVVARPHTVVNQAGEQIAQLVTQDGTIQTMALTDTLSQTEQESSNIISEMDTENDADTSTATLQDGGDSQTEQETIIIREIDPNVTLEGGDEQMVFTLLTNPE